MKPKVLVAEDDPEVCGLIAETLRSSCECRAASSGEEAMKLLWSFEPELLVLDLTLPGFQGLSLLKLLREDPRTGRLPVLVLTADTDEKAMTASFEAGADDFLLKPFKAVEFAARVGALLRRSRGDSGIKKALSLGGITLDLGSREVAFDGKSVPLTRTEFLILQKLVEGAGGVLSKETLIEAFWGSASDVQTHTLDSHVANLRKKLGPYARLIHTIHSVGYLLKS